ncbi:hypothetical protein IKE84_00965 [Candidatus Saccharibacteria bacterium]|nr:hypothetical protein [Candidatus Saccharibacteria bacterium]
MSPKSTRIKSLVSGRRDVTVYYSRKTGLPIDPLKNVKKEQAAKKKAAERKAKRAERRKQSVGGSKKSFLKSLFHMQNVRPRLTEADLINAESSLGAMLFGPIPKGHRREFFRFKHNVWIFHESWFENGEKRETTITYEVRENGVYKIPLGGEYVKIRGAELENFCRATAEYLKLIKTRLY